MEALFFLIPRRNDLRISIHCLGFFWILFKFTLLLSVSSHFGNFLFGCCWWQHYQSIMLQFVYFSFVSRIGLNFCLTNQIRICRVAYFSFRLAHLALQMENIVQKITQPKWQKTKNKDTKICHESGNGVLFKMRDIFLV